MNDLAAAGDDALLVKAGQVTAAHQQLAVAEDGVDGVAVAGIEQIANAVIRVCQGQLMKRISISRRLPLFTGVLSYAE